jgi:hypothetical protein
MTKLIVGLALFFLTLCVAPAGATTTADAPYSEWLAAANMPHVEGLEVVPVSASVCPEDGAVWGCTDMSTYIALAPGSGPRTFLHEEGHDFAADRIYGSLEVEATIAALIDHPKLIWHEFVGNDSSLDEAFADAYSRCGLVGLGHPIVEREWGGYSVGSVEITPRHLLALCTLIRSL